MNSTDNRLTAISADNHQPWLWFIHFFSMIFVAFAACMRVWMKWRHAAWSDALLGVAHLLYIGYWVVLLLALINSLGMSEEVTTDLKEKKAARHVFTSRILFTVILAATKLSTIFFIREIFTRDATKWWFRAIVALVTAQAVIGSLIVSVGCSPTHILDGKDNKKCVGNTPRWIVFSVIEAILECLLVVPVTIIVMTLQTNLQKKIWAITVFACRLVVWVPLWLHLSIYIHFVRYGRANIDFVPTMITEEFWAALALVTASTPVLMRVAKNFTTSGMTLGPTMPYGSKKTSSSQRRTTGFRPDDVTHTSQVSANMLKTMNEGASIGSNAESHVGILRQVYFQVSSENK